MSALTTQSTDNLGAVIMSPAKLIPLPARAEAVLRPPRLTFANRCIWCGIADCADPDCVALHEVSQWRTCRQCDGTGLAFSGPQGCTCAFGLVHVAPVVRRRLRVSAKGVEVFEDGHWSGYNERTYYDFTHRVQEPKRFRPVTPVEEVA
ncbi:hypothetical protein [Nocardia sp. alder85J]|uniref:hypothetical protein n=1 Tax=Nocardia sp. alder85J TaxID=2862949 RepID=UPI001CD61DDA|nr:hypothetical protein [Nocardia sp. alder85J]MCX4097301.1 hypothetical protein [Nocardia sp. alder85J]